MPRHHDYLSAITAFSALVDNDIKKSTSNEMNTLPIQCSDHHGGNDNKTLTNSSFVDALPFELVSAIFAMLNMKQNVCCTQVCHTWRSFILYSWGRLWHELSDDNCNFIHNLKSYPISGQHVKILQMNTRKRRKQSQEIKFLISRQCYYIQTAHLHSGLSKQNFSKLLRLIGPHLRILDLRNQSNPAPDIVLDTILRNCSNLAHLTFYTAPRCIATPTLGNDNNSGNVNKRKWDFLQHYRHSQLMTMALYMHGRTNNMPLDQLLLSLPLLQRISINPYDFPDANHTLNSLYQHSPMLETIHYGHALKSWMTAMATSDKTSSPATTTNRSVLRQLHLSELDINIDERNVIPFITKHHDTLEILDFKFIPNVSNETISNLALFQFPKLKSLTLGIYHGNFYDDTEDDDVMTTEDIEEDDYLVLTTNNNSRGTVRLYEYAESTLIDDLSNFLRQSAPHLEELYLYNLTAANDLFFQALANMHHLHSLTVAFSDQISSESILLFIQHYSSSSSVVDGNSSYLFRHQSLKRLSFQGMDAVNDEVMEQLAKKMTHHLETLDVSECHYISDAGLRSFVDNYIEQDTIPTTPITSTKPKQQKATLKDLNIWGSLSVSLETYEYAQEQLSRKGTTVRYSLF